MSVDVSELRSPAASLCRYYVQHLEEQTPVSGSWRAFWDTSLRLVASLLRLVHEFFPQEPEADQRDAVIRLAGEAFDQLVALLVIPYCPLWLRYWLVHPLLRRLWLSWLHATVQSLFDFFARCDWQDRLQRLCTNPQRLPFAPY